MDQNIFHQKTGAISIIQLNRPQKKNSLNGELRKELETALRDIARDSGVRAAIITGWPWVEELISVCYKWDNVYFGVDGWMPKYLKPEIIHFMNSRMGMDRCLWGTNGLPWKESLEQVQQIGLKEEAKRKLLRENATQLFRL